MYWVGGGAAGVSPEAAGGVAQHLGGVEVELAVVVVSGGGVPVGVGNDDAVGEHGQRVLDDWHLQGVARRKVPQHTCIQTSTGPSPDYWDLFWLKAADLIVGVEQVTIQHFSPLKKTNKTTF